MKARRATIFSRGTENNSIRTSRSKSKRETQERHSKKASGTPAGQLGGAEARTGDGNATGAALSARCSTWPLSRAGFRQDKGTRQESRQSHLSAVCSSFSSSLLPTTKRGPEEQKRGSSQKCKRSEHKRENNTQTTRQDTDTADRLASLQGERRDQALGSSRYGRPLSDQELSPHPNATRAGVEIRRREREERSGAGAKKEPSGPHYVTTLPIRVERGHGSVFAQHDIKERQDSKSKRRADRLPGTS